MRLSGLDLFFWAAGFSGHIVLLIVLFQRQQAGRFPFFTAMIATSVVKTLVLFFMLRWASYAVYFYVYWIVCFVEQFVQMTVLYELAIHVFRPMGRWTPEVKRGSALLGVISLGVAMVITWLSAPPPQLWQQSVVVKSSLFSSALMCELLLGMIVLSATGGFPWRTKVARVALGLGLYSLAEILIEGANNMFGMNLNAGVYSSLAHVRMALYLCCLLYWTWAFWQQSPLTQGLTQTSLDQLSILQERLSQGVGVLRGGRRP